MIKFNRKNFIIFLILFSIEVIIALYITQHFIRHVFGDFLCVIMLYYFFKSFINTKSTSIVITVLIIAYLVEFLQLTHILTYLNIAENSVLRIISGATFSAIDLIAYTLGALTVFLIDKR